METLTVSGKVTNRGSALSYAVSLNICITLWREEGGYTLVDVVHEADLDTNSDGTFDYNYDVSDDIIEAFKASEYGAGGWISVQLTALVAGATTFKFEAAVLAIFSLGQTFVGVASSLVDKLVYDIDLSGLTLYRVTAVLNTDDDTEEAFKNVDSMWCEIVSNPSILPGFPVSTSVVLAGAPGMRDGRDYEARIVLNSDSLDAAPYFVRFTSDGPDFLNEVVVRTFAMSGEELASSQFGLVKRIDEKVGVGTISSDFDDRIFQFPFIITDLDLDIEGDSLHVRGGIGIGTGADFILFSIGEFDGCVSLSFKNRESWAFTKAEFDDLFNVDITEMDYDAVPGTDLDDLPWWFYIAIAPLSPGLSGWAAIVAALEALVTPLIRKEVEKQMVNKLAKEVWDRLEDEIEKQLEAYEKLDDEVVEKLWEAIWFEGEKLEFDPDYIRVFGWAGIWDQKILLMSEGVSDACPFDDSSNDPQNPPSNEQPNDPQPPPSATQTQSAYRLFERSLSVKQLAPWMEEYKRHKRELKAIARKHPELLGRIARFAIKYRKLLKGNKNRTRLPEGAIRDFSELVQRVRRVSSNRLSSFLSNIEKVMIRAAGLTLDKALRLAATEAPSSNRVHVVPMSLIGRSARGLRARRKRLSKG